MRFNPTNDAAFNAGLAEQVGTVYADHPEIDQRDQYPWLHACLGDPKAPVWFLAENPSLTMASRASSADPETQWSVSRGDMLFRRQLQLHGWKQGESARSPGGWHCYITDVLKSPVTVSDWHGRNSVERSVVADWWAPVLHWEIRHGAPKLLVVMGDQARRHLDRWRLNGLLPLDPPTVQVWHYAFRRQSGEGIAEYERQFAAVATLASQL